MRVFMRFPQPLSFMWWLIVMWRSMSGLVFLTFPVDAHIVFCLMVVSVLFVFVLVAMFVIISTFVRRFRRFRTRVVGWLRVVVVLGGWFWTTATVDLFGGVIAIGHVGYLYLYICGIIFDYFLNYPYLYISIFYFFWGFEGRDIYMILINRVLNNVYTNIYQSDDVRLYNSSTFSISHTILPISHWHWNWLETCHRNDCSDAWVWA
jgi:hypothetical protein